MPKVYRLPESMRPGLARPLGRLFRPEETDGPEFRGILSSAELVASVGDRVTETLGALGRTPDVQIVDGMENRKKRSPPGVPYSRLIEVENPPATLSQDAIDGVRSAFSGPKPVRVLVTGEEDLVAIPVIALAPLSTVVFYGQPGEGIVVVSADEEAKSRNRAIMKEMGIPQPP